MLFGSTITAFAREYTPEYGDLMVEHPEGVASIIDSDGAATYYQYDQNGNVVVKQYYNPDAQTTRCYYYEYNAEGKVVKETLVKDSSTTYTQYIYQDNIVLEQRTNSDSPNDVDTTTYIYDANGNLLQEQTSYNEFSYTYDANGNLLQEYFNGTLDCSYTYDEKGRVITQTNVRGYENDDIYYYTYNSNDQIIKIDNEYDHIELTYNQYGDITQKICTGTERFQGGGPYKTIYNYSYTYDEFGRILKEECFNGSEPWSSIIYSY